MTDPNANEAPKRTTRTRGTTEPSAPVPPAAAPAPKSAASGAPSSPTPVSGAPTSSQISGAVSGAYSQVRERLHAGEQLALAGAALVLGVYIIFQVLLDALRLNEVTVVLSVLLLVAIWVHRWGHHDFGSAYRVVVGAMGLSLAVFAVTNFLSFIRLGGGSDAGELLGRIIFWAAGIVAGYGAYLVWKVGRTA
jgi:hypothetical protein